MKLNEVMDQLKEMGTHQKIKIYKRHGINDGLFGVSIANLKKMQKQIKKDQDLAIQLWNTNNFDAKMLATYIADPAKLTPDLVNDWVESIGYYVLSETLSSLITKSPIWKELMYALMDSDKEFVKSTAYYVFAGALKIKKSISEKEIEEQLSIIKSNIHTESNRVKHTMNNVLIAIGVFLPEFQKQALDVARMIGKVDVDHGETSCKTPDAIDYIERTVARNKSLRNN